MSTVNDAIAHTLTRGLFMLKRFTEDLKADEYLHRPSPNANCAAWLIGHLVLSDRTVLQKLGVKDLPELPAGFDKKLQPRRGLPAGGGVRRRRGADAACSTSTAPC